MKRSHLLTILLLCFLVVFGWFATLTGASDVAASEQKLQLESAEKHFDKGLFWKAGQEYMEALSTSGTEELWKTMLDAFASSYAQGDNCYSEYLDAAQAAVRAYSSNEDFLMQLVSLYLDQDNYALALSALNHARSSGVESATVMDKILEVSYAYELLWESYDQVGSFSNGYLPAYSNGEWSYVNEAGDHERVQSVTGLGPMGANGIRPLLLDGKLVFQNDLGVPQGIISGNVEQIGVYAEELIPVKVDGVFSYYNLIGEKQFGSFDEAGTFTNSYAAVRKGSSWYLLDKSGSLSSDTFEEIVLNEDGSWISGGVMLAKKNGKFHLYDANLKQIGDGAWDDVDVVCGYDAIAVCSNGKWGFVNSSGNVVIAPSYTEARSFSNGLAAVYDGSSWGFIDSDGVLVIKYQFQDVGYFTKEGCCMVLTDEGWKMLSRYITQ